MQNIAQALWLSLGVTVGSVLLAVLAVAVVVPECWHQVAGLGAPTGVAGWLLFFVPVLVWERRRKRQLGPASMASLGCAAGALFPGFFLAANGAYFWEWHAGHPMPLSLLAIPVAALAGWTFATLRLRFQSEARGHHPPNQAVHHANPR